MKEKSLQELYDGMIDASTWHQQPCPVDDDFSIITIRLPNRNINITEELHGFDAFKKIISFCNKLPAHLVLIHRLVEKRNTNAITHINTSLMDKLSYLLNEK